VLLFRERGRSISGVDWSTEALAACHRVRPAPLAAMDLTQLALREASFAAYVSLGVIEHDPAGPDAILAEARRVLRPGGIAIVSAPYVNGLRRLTAPLIRRRARAVAAAGGEFYQYAFTRAELTAALARHGMRVIRAVPYDPARALRKLLRRGTHRVASRETVPSDAPRTSLRIVRRLLYTPAALRLLGHMLLVVARRD
jgi:SAM-dependent methyltransferase